MRGEVPRQLNDESNAKILSMLEALRKDDGDRSALGRPFPASCEQSDPTLKEAREKLSQYRQTDMRGSEQQQGWEAEMSMPGTNPFKLPMKYFQARKGE